MVRALAISLVLMASIGLSTYVALEIWHWPKPRAMTAVFTVNLLLTVVLLRVFYGPFEASRPGFDKDGPPGR